MRIAIIGAGFSGTALTLHLARQPWRQKPEILLFAPKGHVGRGLAYQAESWHLLNVPAARMSAIPELPHHFLDWVRQREPDVTGSTFMPRPLYGTYLQETLQREAAGAFTTIPEPVEDLEQTARGWTLHLPHGQRLDADIVVMATGNPLPARVPGLDPGLQRSPRYIENPWNHQALDNIAPQERLLVVGSGLTMVDVVLSLRARGHRGPIQAISRRGLRSASHAAQVLAPRLPEVPVVPGMGLRALVRTIRQAIRQAETQHEPWQWVIDALRPITWQLFQGLSESDKRQFLRHVRPWWDAHRHRLAPQLAERIDDLIGTGILQIRAARIQAIEAAGEALKVTLQPRGTETQELLLVDRVINATGPDTDLSRSGDGLIKRLLARGTVVQDALKLGLVLDGFNRAVKGSGEVHQTLYLLGPVRRALDWEGTAVPDLSKHAYALAIRLQTLLDHDAAPASRQIPVQPAV